VQHPKPVTTMGKTRVPYGLGWGFGDKPVPIAKHMKIVEEVLRLRQSGETLQAIANHLNRRGVPSPRGKRGGWLTSSVNAIVRHRNVYEPFLRSTVDWKKYGIEEKKK
jgi:recombinase